MCRIINCVCGVQVPDAELEGFEEKRETAGDVAECGTKCRDEQTFTCR